MPVYSPSPPPLPQADQYNHALRLVNVSTGLVTTLAGNSTQSTGHADGAGTAASFDCPVGVSLNSAGTLAIVVSAGERRGEGVWITCMCSGMDGRVGMK